MGRSFTAPPPWGPMMLAFHRYWEKEAESREAKAKEAFPQRKALFPELTFSW